MFFPPRPFQELVFCSFVQNMRLFYYNTEHLFCQGVFFYLFRLVSLMPDRCFASAEAFFLYFLWKKYQNHRSESGHLKSRLPRRLICRLYCNALFRYTNVISFPLLTSIVFYHCYYAPKLVPFGRPPGGNYNFLHRNISLLKKWIFGESAWHLVKMVFL